MRRAGIRFVGSLALLTGCTAESAGRVAAPRAAGVAPARGGGAQAVYIFGITHRAWFVQVEERDGDQVAVDDPCDRLEEFQQLDAETREVAGG